jgi:hypothetical protein
VTPAKRFQNPEFYGYIPDRASRRTLVFGCMIMNGALLLLLRSLSTALLLMAGGKWWLAYFGGDMVLYERRERQERSERERASERSE